MAAPVPPRLILVCGERHPSHSDATHLAAMDAGGFDWDVYLPPADVPFPVVTVDGSRPPDALLAETLAAR